MKNIQIIDGAINCVYDVFQATEEDFDLIFPNGTDIAFSDELDSREEKKEISEAIERLWKNRISKKRIEGLHGTIFFECEQKKEYYPTRIDDEATNPDGTKLRA